MNLVKGHDQQVYSMDIYTNYTFKFFFVLSYTVYNSIILYTYCKVIYYFFNIAIIKNVD
jgi:hypothetical protein